MTSVAGNRPCIVQATPVRNTRPAPEAMIPDPTVEPVATLLPADRSNAPTSSVARSATVTPRIVTDDVSMGKFGTPAGTVTESRVPGTTPPAQLLPVFQFVDVAPVQVRVVP